MAHEITTVDHLAYTGETPWHGLGTRVDGLMTSEDALVYANLDWEVEKIQLHLPDGNEAPGCFATVRQDTGDVLGGVGKDYTPLQNRDAFEFMDGVVGEAAAMYEVAGSLKAGRRVWLLVRIPERVAVMDRDEIDRYLLLANGHDGTMGVVVQYTPVRVVCNNTLTAALSHAGRRFSAVHRGRLARRMEEAREVLGLAHQYFEDFVQEAERLARAPVTSMQTATALSHAFQVDREKAVALVVDPSTAKTPREKGLTAALALSENGMGNQSFRGTAWGLYNGVTEYVDHHWSSTPGVRGGTAAENRLDRSWFGTGGQLRQRAFDALVSLAN